jgi:hypothetical protein
MLHVGLKLAQAKEREVSERDVLIEMSVPFSLWEERRPELWGLHILDDLRSPDMDKTHLTSSLDRQRHRFMGTLDLLVQEAELTVGVNVGPYGRPRLMAKWPHWRHEPKHGRYSIFPFLVAVLVNRLVEGRPGLGLCRLCGLPRERPGTSYCDACGVAQRRLSKNRSEGKHRERRNARRTAKRHQERAS